jgi:hypothetical protein
MFAEILNLNIYSVSYLKSIWKILMKLRGNGQTVTVFIAKTHEFQLNTDNTTAFGNSFPYGLFCLVLGILFKNFRVIVYLSLPGLTTRKGRVIIASILFIVRDQFFKKLA